MQITPVSPKTACRSSATGVPVGLGRKSTGCNTPCSLKLCASSAQCCLIIMGARIRFGLLDFVQRNLTYQRICAYFFLHRYATRGDLTWIIRNCAEHSVANRRFYFFRSSLPALRSQMSVCGTNSKEGGDRAQQPPRRPCRRRRRSSRPGSEN